MRIIKTFDGKFIFDPTFEEEPLAKITILVAGTDDAITMVEAEAKEVSDEEMVESLEFAHNLVKQLSTAQADFIAEYKKTYGESIVKEFYNKPDETLYEKVKEYLTEERLQALYNTGKKEFQHTLDKFDDEVKDYLLQNNFVTIMEGSNYDEVKAGLTYV